MVETPVLYITFARPEYASQSFAAIKKAQPKKLYFYSNKARDEKPDEVARNLEVRSYINQIDWDCEVKTWFRDEYVDVFTSLWGAIDWVFNNEEKAIIVEEDCKASLAFFDYCEKMLNLYKDDDRIWLISGNNFTPEFSPSDRSYFFSKYPGIWGWASWRSRWNKLYRKMEIWPEFRKKGIYKYFGNPLAALWMSHYFDQHYKIVSTGANPGPWDYIFELSRISNNGFAVIPSENLVADIGLLGENHHADAQPEKLNIFVSEKETFDVVGNPSIVVNDSHYDSCHFFKRLLLQSLQRKFRKLIHKLK